MEVTVSLKIGSEILEHRVDVVGYSPQGKIAVECGNLDVEKLNKLRSVFKEVIHLTTDDLVLHFNSVIQDAQREINRLRRQKVMQKAKGNSLVEKFLSRAYRVGYRYLPTKEGLVLVPNPTRGLLKAPKAVVIVKDAEGK